MNILILGGTGTIGLALINELKTLNHTLWITSRVEHKSNVNVNYINGNAKDNKFIMKVLERDYDVIVDFMNYSTIELSNRIELILSHTKHYFFISSGRVYAGKQGKITEDSPRLLDVCTDKNYLSTDEYALAKAREENILRKCKFNNWTIIRPYITYGNYRLQLGVLEKENWLYRAIHGRTIIFFKDIAARMTTLTCSSDVSHVIAELIGNDNVKGETFHITTNETMTWNDILNRYLEIFEKQMGVRPKVLMLEESIVMKPVWNHYQIKYDRLFNRSFDNMKILKLCSDINYKGINEGICECLTNFLDNPMWLNINWKYEAWADRLAHEHTPLKEIPGIKNKLRYLKWRYIKM